ncbi:MFS transporter [Paraburkholderia phenoliruptrix]|uniref:MFS transporter n=1 Tax=Paraburkholderia phenoliruptrix TaxID=252970 RepID=UPI001CB76EAB|nr:MFS transporter [Paraburkholderia phenoliruptrix]
MSAIEPSSMTVDNGAAHERRALYAKVAWRIMPVLILCYFFAYLDRVNIGYAKLQMLGDLGMSEAAYGLGAGLFFIGYLLFEVPSNLLMTRIGARKTICRIMVLWGLISIAFAFVDKPWQFYLLRVLLGAAEAGFYPGIILFLTYWFPSHARGRMTAIFFAAVPISGVLGGPVSGMIIERLHGAVGAHGWQWLFILEGIPSVLVGLCIPFILTDKPSQATWLSADEKNRISADLEAEHRFKETVELKGTSVSGVFAKGMVWYLIAICLCQTLALNGIAFWLPTLIKSLGVSGAFEIGMLSAIPYLAAAISLVVFGRSADRRMERKWHTAIPFLMVSAGLAASVHAHGNLSGALLLLAVATAGAYTVAGMFWALPSLFLNGTRMAAAIAFINSVGGLGGFFGPSLIGFVKDTTGSTDYGVYFIAATSILGALLVAFLPRNVVNR